ncbi:hypothetical protein N8I77_002231 [Diaporthe amygdali]|uniref:phosphoribosylamine--glycine ligase n=1 Tax=Phomopsis amygdali TaxID=1214568 RepID=A0AAD9WB16_PHOAM|nr:hypothetical protein N8I77_002231 [Diaporthe amygdali]
MDVQCSPKLKVLLVGKGGREHALAWKLVHSPSVEHVFVVPGNGGTASLPGVTNIDDIAANDYPGLVRLSQDLDIGLVVAGPDDAVDGIEGFFRGSIPCFAPSKEAAEVEGSKVFAKNFMKKYQIPTAEYHHFDNYDEASQYLDSTNHRIVIKVDGLAAGKGVVLPQTREEAQDFLRNIMVEAKFGPAGQSVVIEDFMDGDEISVSTFSDGKTFKSLPPGQDHKRVFEGDRGPNTGGMGVFAPVDFVSRGQMRGIDQKILRPTFDGLKAEGRTFVGLLFTGIMITPSGEPKVLEYNARFGDPETQTMMLLLANKDLATILLSCVAGELDGTDIQARAGYACNVVVAAGGYPNSYRSGDEISVNPSAHLENSSTALQVFHAGTKLVDGKLVTSGGRVLSVAAYAPTLQGALDSAYTGIKNIQFNNMHFRKDIAARVRQK